VLASLVAWRIKSHQHVSICFYRFHFNHSPVVGILAHKRPTPPQHHKQDTALLKRLRDAGWLSSAAHGRPRLVVVIRPSMEGSGQEEALASLSSELGVPVVSVEEVLAVGAKHRPHYRAPELQPHDLLTLVYTSGTTGRPKGVMLTHGNLLHQIKHISLDDSDMRSVGPADVVLSLLPCWHIFERSSELYALSRGGTLVYSTVRDFKAHLHAYKPHFLIVVPRLLENGASRVSFC
jgi:long-subunit acyl-CoA synthetase (AMP-forming)